MVLEAVNAGRYDGRTMVAMNDIRTLADRIASAFDPQRIILFGSHAIGTSTPDSDVDLLVILAFEGKGF